MTGNFDIVVEKYDSEFIADLYWISSSGDVSDVLVAARGPDPRSAVNVLSRLAWPEVDTLP